MKTLKTYQIVEKEAEDFLNEILLRRKVDLVEFKETDSYKRILAKVKSELHIFTAHKTPYTYLELNNLLSKVEPTGEHIIANEVIAEAYEYIQTLFKKPEEKEIIGKVCYAECEFCEDLETCRGTGKGRYSEPLEPE